MSQPQPTIVASTVPVESAPLVSDEIDLLTGAAAAAIHFLEHGAVNGHTTGDGTVPDVQAIEAALTAECRVILEQQIRKPVRSFEIKYLYHHDADCPSENTDQDQQVCYVQIDAIVAKDWRRCVAVYPFAGAFATFCFYLVYETVVMPFTPADFDVVEAAYRWWIIRAAGLSCLLLKGIAQFYETKLMSAGQR